jgi:8-oxo-dGTP pyrophosphatase MutT (NUDIX family)
MMCVDPVKDKEDNDSDYYSYERVIPTAGRGSVIIARHNNKFVLLKQYRHALRRYQYAFPRGYGEPELTTDVNAVKELWEELKAKPLSEPVFIGSVSPDSGLTRTAADVYVIEIGNYSTDNGYEGIKDTVELSEDELEKMISSNHSEKESIFDDGFTLASYSLFRQHQLALS